MIGLTLSTFVPGAGVILIASKVIPPILDFAEEITEKPVTDTAIIISIIALVIFCVGSLSAVLFRYNFSPPEPDLTPSSIIPIVPNLATSTILPPTNPTQIIPASTALTTTNISEHPVDAWISSPNYCLYVVQPKDTIQGVASWFGVSENDIRNSDSLVNQGVLKTNQLVRVNAPCCTRIGVDNGFSYSVKPKDNVFRLAINFSTSVDKIVSANNLSDSRYIQAGQMLCIPYP